jgi:hypothetical protein
MKRMNTLQITLWSAWNYHKRNHNQERHKEQNRENGPYANAHIVATAMLLIASGNRNCGKGD